MRSIRTPADPANGGGSDGGDLLSRSASLTERLLIHFLVGACPSARTNVSVTAGNCNLRAAGGAAMTIGGGRKFICDQKLLCVRMCHMIATIGVQIKGKRPVARHPIKIEFYFNLENKKMF